MHLGGGRRLELIDDQIVDAADCADRAWDGEGVRREASGAGHSEAALVAGDEVGWARQEVTAEDRASAVDEVLLEPYSSYPVG